MSILFNDANTEEISVSASPISDRPLTFSVWFNSNDDAARQGVISVLDASVPLDYCEIRLRGDQAGDFVQARINSDLGGGGNNSTSSSGYSVNTWHHVAATFTNAAQIFLDGVSSTTSGTKSPGNFDSIGVASRFASGENYFSGKLAELAIWNLILPQEVISELAAGVRPCDVSIVPVFYLEGASNNYDDLIGGLSLTAGGTPVQGDDHPPIIRTAEILQFPPVAVGGTEFFQTLSGILVPVGPLVRQTQRTLSSAVAPTGAINKDALINIAGGTTPIGTVNKETTRSMIGSMTPSGAVATTTVFSKIVSGILTPVGQVLRKTLKQVAGLVTSAGAVNKLTDTSVSGGVAPTGATLVTILTQLVSGAVTAIGALVTVLNPTGNVGFSNPGGQFPGLANHSGEWTAFIIAAGGTIKGDLQSDARNALAAAVGISEVDALSLSMNDLWKRYELAGFPKV